MMKWPALWLPPFMMSALQLMAGGPYASDAAHGVVLVTANLGVFIIEAGWLAMIRQAVADKAPTMETFKEGVNAHWWPLVVGSLAFYAVMAGLLMLAVYLGEQRYGHVALEQWVQTIKDLPPDKLEAHLQTHQLPSAISGWAALVAAWVAAAGLTGLVLLFWQPLTVLRDLPWWRAWGASAKLLGSRLLQTLAIAILQGATLFLGVTVMLAGSPIFAFLGLGMVLAAMTYFKIAYATVVADAFPPIDARA
ncbi:MAG: hypothetical protein JWM80_1560 [Cyanobacteria bacterium RYN_339]|nr:hypothetical protein [Cyanobacteria bacterium RYN_339]